MVDVLSRNAPPPPPVAPAMPNRDRLRGLLLGTALGDALGLPMEGMKPHAITRRFGRIDRYFLVGSRGYVSDDTEQAALVAQSLALSQAPSAVIAAFRRALRGWFWRLPFGIGLSTLKACLRLSVGMRNSGVRSAGNGATMRAPIVGLVIDDPTERRALAEALARVTHTDPRAVEGAVFVTHLAAGAGRATPTTDRRALVATARADVRDAALAAALDHALTADLETLPTTGFVLNTVALVTRIFIDHGDDPLEALRVCIRLGGDTDTHAALVGALCGALHGEAGLPTHLINRLAPGPFGPTHLRALADALATGGRPPGFSAAHAMVRNLALYPVILAHGFRRMWWRVS